MTRICGRLPKNRIRQPPSRTRTASALHVEIADDGCGIPADHDVGVGLSSMLERAVELGGFCTFQAAPGGGTLVRAVLPNASAAQIPSWRGA